MAKQNYAKAKGRSRKLTALSNLGLCLQQLGEQDAYSDRLNKSVKVFVAAIKIAKAPSQQEFLAICYSNVAGSYILLSERESKLKHLQAAVDATEIGIRIGRKIGAKDALLLSLGQLGRALSKTGEHEENVDTLSKALSVQEESGSISYRGSDKIGGDLNQTNVGLTKLRLGRLTKDISILESAHRNFLVAQERKTYESEPFYWAFAEWNLGV